MSLEDAAAALGGGRPKRPAPRTRTAGGAAAAPAAKKSSGFAVGSKIECRHGGGSTYFPGVIAARDPNNGSYSIDYDDGDKETGVPTTLIKAAEAAAAAPPPEAPEAAGGAGFAAGDAVECRHGGGQA